MWETMNESICSSVRHGRDGTDKTDLQRNNSVFTNSRNDSRRWQCDDFDNSSSDTCGTVNSRIVDMVNHPPHYKSGKLECIEVIENFNLNFHLGNAVKYILRADKKGKQQEDLQKAIWYLQRELKRVSSD